MDLYDPSEDHIICQNNFDVPQANIICLANLFKWYYISLYHIFTLSEVCQASKINFGTSFQNN